MKFFSVGENREEAQHISRQKFDGTHAIEIKDMSPAERKELWEMTLKAQEKMSRTSLRYCIAMESILCGFGLGLVYLVARDSGVGARR